MKKLLISLFLPLIPLYILFFVIFMLDLEGPVLLIPVLYLTMWLVFFLLVMINMYEVMVVYKDRIVFINPYKEKVLLLQNVKMIYYHFHRGLSFRMANERTVNMGFRFGFERSYLEGLFRVISGFMEFSEEHLTESDIYCLVNNRK